MPRKKPAMAAAETMSVKMGILTQAVRLLTWTVKKLGLATMIVLFVFTLLTGMIVGWIPSFFITTWDFAAFKKDMKQEHKVVRCLVTADKATQTACWKEHAGGE